MSQYDVNKLFKEYFKSNSIVASQIESYNWFVSFGIQQIINNTTLSQPGFKATFDAVYVSKPTVIEQDRTHKLVFPQDARQRDLAYDTAICCDITETIQNKPPKQYFRVPIGRIPVMLRSCICNLSSLTEKECIKEGECPKDLGGYFIINGNERVLVAQMRNNYNQIFVLPQKPGDKYKYITDVRSMSEQTGHSVLIQVLIGSDDRELVFSLPNIKQKIPIGVVFKAFGISDDDIVSLIRLQDQKSLRYIRFIIRDAFFCKSKEDALDFIGQYIMQTVEPNKRRDCAWQIIETELLPHTGIAGSIQEQVSFLASMVRKLIMTNIGLRKPDDRDNYSHKRVDVAGTLLYEIFRNIWKKSILEMQKQLDKRKQIPDVMTIISRLKLITKNLNSCMSTGNWGIQKNATYVKTGVSQVLDRMTYCATLSHLRRVLIPVGKDAKNTAMRQIHPTSFGFICPCECFDPETSILLSNNSVVKAKHIKVGDMLLDDNGAPTRVRSTCSGFNMMYMVNHTDPKFTDYVVTENHILTLKAILHKTKRNNRIIYFDREIHDYVSMEVNSSQEADFILSGISDDNVVDITIENFLKHSPLLHAFKFNSEETTNFILLKQGVGPFVGWQLEGNGRFLLPDNTVVHNTPEGQKIGIVLNLALTSGITRKIPTVDTRKILEKLRSVVNITDLPYSKHRDMTPVFLNGTIIAFTQDPDSTIQEFKNLRSKRIINPQISITYDFLDDEIKIFCDEGRYIRPLLSVTNNSLNLKPSMSYDWENLVKKGIIQYIDASEIENSVIAMTPEYLTQQQNDFCEMHPYAMLGIMAAMIPFPDHNQSPRNCYQSSMGKQALGIPALTYNIRSDTVLHVLHYSQKPLISTMGARLLGINEMPSGINAIVAVLAYTGFNQEDSTMLNGSSIDRGLFHVTKYFTIDCIEKKRDTYSYEEICLPPYTSNRAEVKRDDPRFFERKSANYSLLDKNGIIRPRENWNEEMKRWEGNSIVVKKGDVIIGKVVVTGNKTGEEKKIDASVVIQPGEEGTIDRIETYITPHGYKLVKVIIRTVRVPKLGDKFASRNAQKGTLGMIYRQEDMPFTAQGIVPDIIINPLCFPSRMTTGQLIECALGKECCLEGKYEDCTPFTDESVDAADKMVERVCDQMKNYGFDNPHGWEYMSCGFTGKLMKSKVFIGPTYYQRLKHMVDDKMHARAKGTVTILTRQPPEGRAREGGLRFGEMERDCMIAHGGVSFLKERLFKVSDPFSIVICDKCGTMTTSKTECHICLGNKVTNTNLPYASKLLFTELQGMGIKLQITPR